MENSHSQVSSTMRLILLLSLFYQALYLPVIIVSARPRSFDEESTSHTIAPSVPTLRAADPSSIASKDFLFPWKRAGVRSQ